MANVSLVNTNTSIKLAPGQTEHVKWSNATPGFNSVWSANAVPHNTTSSASPNQDSSGEITRLWRRLIVTDKSSPGQQIADIHIEHEIHFEVKNVGNTEATFNVFLSAIS